MKVKRFLSYVVLGVLIFLIMTPIISTYTKTNSPDNIDVIEEVEVTESVGVIEVTEPEKELLADPLLFPEVGYYQYFTYWAAVDHQDAIIWYVEQLNNAINSGLYTPAAIDAMLEEVSRLELDIMLLQFDLDNLTRWQEEYPVATQVWCYLRNNGFSEEVAAGIIGNMMVECGGATMTLHPLIYDNNKAFYGLCQWSVHYYPEARNLEVDEQLELLLSTIQGEFSTFGFCYKRNFTYQDFLSLDNPEDAAKAFAKVYERCAAGSYNLRSRCAREAYDYFTLNEVAE